MDSPAYIVQVDALYFQARENGVSYAMVDGKVQNPDFNNRFGARARVGIDLHHDNWQLWAQFFHYHSRISDNRSDKEFSPTWGQPAFNPGGFVDHVDNLWRLHMGLLDLNLTRCWAVSHCLKLWPFWGLRYSEIRHKLKVNYQGGTLFPGGGEFFSMKNKFWGGGPNFGMETLWHFTDWVGMFARGGCTLSLGMLYIHQDEMISTGDTQFKLIDKFYQTRKILEMALGLDFRYCINCTAELYARIGWEAYLLYGQNQLPYFVDDQMTAKFVNNQGDLSISGLSIGLGICF